MKKDSMKKDVFESILTVFAWLSFTLAIIMAILTIFSSFSGEKNGEEVFGFRFLIVESDSMSRSTLSQEEAEFFDAGDIIIIKAHQNGAEYKVGEIISFVSRNPDSVGETLTHKIREVNYSHTGNVTGYTTYGINTGINDKALVSPDTIIGSYSGKIPKLGYLFSYLKTPAGYYLSILTPLVLLTIFFSINVGRYFGRKQAIKESIDTPSVSKSGLTVDCNEFENLCARVAILESKLASALTLAPTVENPERKQLEEKNIVKKQKRSFLEKLLGLEQTSQQFFNTLHNQLVSYKRVNDRVSLKAVSYRLGRKLIAKITVRGKTLKLHLALNVNDFNKNAFFQKDLSSVKTYSEVPFTVKIKSPRGEKNAVKLINALMEKNGSLKKDNFVPLNIISIFKNEDVQAGTKTYVQADTNEVATTCALSPIVIKAKRVPFAEKLLGLEQASQQFFNTLHNQLVSYKRVNDRVSLKAVSYRLGRKLIAKITVRGKTLKLHLALNVNDFNKNAFFQKDLSSVKTYSEVPFTVKIKSPRGERNAVKLINALMEKNMAIKKTNYVQVNSLDLIKNK